MQDDDQDNEGGAPYPVGYGKSPVSTQFKPGSSGNPKGRTKGAKSPGTLLRSFLNEKITVNEGGVEKKISRMDALIRQTYSKALKDPKAATALINLAKAVGVIELEREDPDADAARKLADEDIAILNRLGYPGR